MKKFEIGKKYVATIWGAENENLNYEIEITSRNSESLSATVRVEEFTHSYRYTWPTSELCAEIKTGYNAYNKSEYEYITFKGVRPITIKAFWEVL